MQGVRNENTQILIWVLSCFFLSVALQILTVKIFLLNLIFAIGMTQNFSCCLTILWSIILNVLLFFFILADSKATVTDYLCCTRWPEILSCIADSCTPSSIFGVRKFASRAFTHQATTFNIVCNNKTNLFFK